MDNFFIELKSHDYFNQSDNSLCYKSIYRFTPIVVYNFIL